MSVTESEHSPATPEEIWEILRQVAKRQKKLARFREWLPAYSGHRLYGAVAYLEADQSVVRHAERRGLFVIRATGSSASIVNQPGFEPRLFGRAAAT